MPDSTYPVNNNHGPSSKNHLNANNNIQKVKYPVKMDNKINKISHAKLMKQIGHIIFSLIGLICASVLIFMILTANYSKIFNADMLSSCDITNNNSTTVSTDSTQKQIITAYNYLKNIQIIQKLIIILNIITISLFLLLIILSLIQIFKRNLEQSQNYIFLFSIKTIIMYMVLLSSGCLLGNLIKTIISIDRIYYSLCLISSNEYYIKQFYYNLKSLCLLGGICLLCGIIGLGTYPILYRKTEEQKEEQGKKKYAIKYQDQSRTNLNLDHSIEKVEKMIGTDDQGFDLNYLMTTNKKTNHQSRIFGKVFLTESRYGLSPRTASKNIQKQQKQNQVNSEPNKQLAPMPVIHLNLGLQENNKNLNSHQNNNKSKHVNYVDHHHAQSHIVSINQNGPPLQMGQFIQNQEYEKGSSSSKNRKQQKNIMINKEISQAKNQEQNRSNTDIIQRMGSRRKQRIFK